MYGFAEIAGSKSAEKTCLPLTVQENLLRILRATGFPFASLRRPVSITCDTRALTSTMSPLVACFLSSLMRGLSSTIADLLDRACEARSAAAAADRDLHLLAGLEHGTVVHLRNGDDVLGFRQSNARIDLGNAARRRKVKGCDAAARITLRHNQDIAHIRLLGHRAFDRNGHGDGVAVLGNLRQIKPHASFGSGLSAGEFLDQLVRVILGGECGPRRGARGRSGRRTDGDSQNPAAMQRERHISIVLEQSPKIFIFCKYLEGVVAQNASAFPRSHSGFGARRKAFSFERTR